MRYIRKVQVGIEFLKFNLHILNIVRATITPSTVNPIIFHAAADEIEMQLVDIFRICEHCRDHKHSLGHPRIE